MWSAVEGEPLKIAGIVPFPYMPFDTLAPAIQWWILDWGEGIHALLILLLVAMIPIHVGAALKHHFWDRHDVLRGLLPDLEGDAEKRSEEHTYELQSLMRISYDLLCLKTQKIEDANTRHNITH